MNKRPDPANLPTTLMSVRLPPKARRVMLTARDRLGPYPVPFPCEYDGEGFKNAETGARVTVEVVAWRLVHTWDIHPPYKPSRLAFLHQRAHA